MKASSVSFKTAIVFGLAGMVMGIAMGVSQNHSVMPAHAHLNLIGWVSLFLIGIYYKFNPILDTSRSALAQVWIWVFGTVVMTTGIAAIYLGNPGAEPIAIAGSLVILADMIFFAFLVFRPHPGETAAAQLAPAE